jgi:hypothetical protein
LIECQEFI